MLVYGFHPIREALRGRPQEIRKVLICAAPGKRRAEIERLCAEAGISWEQVDATALAAVASGVHNGFAAETAAAAGSSASGAGDPDLVVLLEDIQDPRNLGALLRVCEGAGVGRVLLRDRGSAPLSPTVVKTSAGAAEWLDVERVTNSANAMDELREGGFWLYGAAMDGEAPWNVDLTGKVVLCLGGEEKGLRRRTRETCDRLIALPMRGRIESLNVATAAAALLYEAVRQRS